MSLQHKVMHISCLHPWNDTRILFREARTLSKEHKVELHAIADFKTRDYKGVKIVGLKKWPLWARPVQWFKLGWRAFRNSATVVHFHDPELLFVGLILRLFGKQVIYDVHEDVYNDILFKNWIPKPLRHVIAKIYFIFHKLSDRYLSAIITATPTIAARFNNQQLTIVRNYPPLEAFSNNGQVFQVSNKKNPIQLIYVGTLNRSRGVLNIIKALKHLPSDFDYKMNIVGAFADSTDFEKEVMETAATFGKYITFHGRLEFPDALLLMSKAHIGLVCTQPTVNDLVGIPLKLFEYMATGLGVIISDFPSWQTYTEYYPAHEFVDPMDPQNIASGIIALVDRWPSDVSKWEQARKKTMSEYNWQAESVKLSKLYNSL